MQRVFAETKKHLEISRLRNRQEHGESLFVQLNSTQQSHILSQDCEKKKRTKEKASNPKQDLAWLMNPCVYFVSMPA